MGLKCEGRCYSRTPYECSGKVKRRLIRKYRGRYGDMLAYEKTAHYCGNAAGTDKKCGFKVIDVNIKADVSIVFRYYFIVCSDYVSSVNNVVKSKLRGLKCLKR